MNITFRKQLALGYGLLLCLTLPVITYGLSCHLQWVCLYALAVVLISAALSLVMLKEVNRRQRQFNTDVAHELRTPLTSLRGTLEALQDGVWQPTPDRLASCGEEVTRLTALVEVLSLLTNIEWEYVKLNKTSFDLAELLKAVCKQFSAAAAQKGISLKLELQTQTVYSDYDRLRQVFVNILSNAIKYTDVGGVIVSNNGKDISIADTGIGIAAEALPHIFERFYRTDVSRARATGGSGIGLTIASALIKAHGGTIVAESEPGKGSVFRVKV
jgi:signal transduction histidine kinase